MRRFLLVECPFWCSMIDKRQVNWYMPKNYREWWVLQRKALGKWDSDEQQTEGSTSEDDEEKESLWRWNFTWDLIEGREPTVWHLEESFLVKLQSQGQSGLSVLGVQEEGESGWSGSSAVDWVGVGWMREGHGEAAYAGPVGSSLIPCAEVLLSISGMLSHFIFSTNLRKGYYWSAEKRWGNGISWSSHDFFKIT